MLLYMNKSCLLFSWAVNLCFLLVFIGVWRVPVQTETSAAQTRGHVQCPEQHTRPRWPQRRCFRYHKGLTWIYTNFRKHLWGLVYFSFLCCGCRSVLSYRKNLGLITSPLDGINVKKDKPVNYIHLGHLYLVKQICMESNWSLSHRKITTALFGKAVLLIHQRQCHSLWLGVELSLEASKEALLCQE